MLCCGARGRRSSRSSSPRAASSKQPFCKSSFWVAPGKGRKRCEDRAICDEKSGRRLDDDYVFAAVIDGHGGDDCSVFLQRELSGLVAFGLDFEKAASSTVPSAPEEIDRRAVVRAIVEADARFGVQSALRQTAARSGACLAVAMVRRSGTVTVANAGDARAVLVSRGGVASELSVAHRCSVNLDERERVEALGAELDSHSRLVCRTKLRRCSIEPSRTVGDHDLKTALGDKILIATPNSVTYRMDSTEYPPAALVLATDGVFDVLTIAQLGHNVLGSIMKPHCNSPAKALVDEAVRRGSYDDTTAVVFEFPPASFPSSSAAAAPASPPPAPLNTTASSSSEQKQQNSPNREQEDEKPPPPAEQEKPPPAGPSGD